MAIVSKTANSSLDNNSWVVRCDKCGKEAHRRAYDIGDAAVCARNEGFKPVFASAEDPAQWLCPDCQQVK